MYRTFFSEPDYVWSRNYYKVKQTEQEYIYSIDLVKIDKSKLKLSVKENNLILSYDNQEDKRRTTFDWSISLPTNVNASKITSKYEDGELTITVPKKEIDTFYINID